MSEPRTAIVTGAGKRVGAVVARALLDRGWTVVGHVRRDTDTVPAGAVKAVAELSDRNCADSILERAEALPPLRLLVNCAARFVHDDLDGFDADELDAHIAVNLRAPILLTRAFAERCEEGGGLVVNILDSKLAAPNPDFLSYTLSKQALDGFTRLAARALAPRGIRVNGVAPALMLPSAGQSAANFDAMHAANPLGIGVEPDDVADAVLYLSVARIVTGQVLVLDGGQHFRPPPRDVQFLESR